MWMDFLQSLNLCSSMTASGLLYLYLHGNTTCSEIMKWLCKNTNPLKIYLCYTQAQNYLDVKYVLYAFSNINFSFRKC